MDDDCDFREFCTSNECVPEPIACSTFKCGYLCSNDDSCDTNEFCGRDGFCAEFGTGLITPECVGDRDCGFRSVCLDNECVPEPQLCAGRSCGYACGDDDDCDRSEFCGRDGICVEFGTGLIEPECRGDRDCGFREFCASNECVPEPQVCGGRSCGYLCGPDDSCAPNEFCGRDGICVEFGMGLIEPECTLDNDCGFREFCFENECVPEPQLCAGRDCGYPCGDDDDCDGGEFCGRFGICVEFGTGLIEPECRENSECGPGEFCIEDECVNVLRAE